MGTTLQTIDSILKTQYLGPVREQLNNATVLLNRIDKDQDSVVGKNFTIPVHFGGNTGVGSAGENAVLPTAGNQQYKDTIVPMKYVYGVINLTGPTIKAAKSNEGAFLRAVESEMKGVTLDLKKKLNKMLWGDGTGNTGLDLMGLAGIVKDSGVLQSLDPATYAWWKSKVYANAGTPRAITENLIQIAIDETEDNSDGKISALFTTKGVRRAYAALLQADRQYQNVKEYAGGFKALTYVNGDTELPIFTDKDCPAGSLFGLTEDQLKMYEMADYDWMQEDGAILSRVSGKDAYEGVLYRYAELGTSARNTHFLLKDLIEA